MCESVSLITLELFSAQLATFLSAATTEIFVKSLVSSLLKVNNHHSTAAMVFKKNPLSLLLQGLMKDIQLSSSWKFQTFWATGNRAIVDERVALITVKVLMVKDLFR